MVSILSLYLIMFYYMVIVFKKNPKYCGFNVNFNSFARFFSNVDIIFEI